MRKSLVLDSPVPVHYCKTHQSVVKVIHSMVPNGRCLSKDKLDEYIFGRLPPKAAAKFELHKNKCKTCKANLMEAKRFIQGFRDLTRAPDAIPSDAEVRKIDSHRPEKVNKLL